MANVIIGARLVWFCTAALRSIKDVWPQTFWVNQTKLGQLLFVHFIGFFYEKNVSSVHFAVSGRPGLEGCLRLQDAFAAGKHVFSKDICRFRNKLHISYATANSFKEEQHETLSTRKFAKCHPHCYRFFYSIRNKWQKNLSIASHNSMLIVSQKMFFFLT